MRVTRNSWPAKLGSAASCRCRAAAALALLDLGRGRLEEAITRYEEVRRLAADWGIAHPYYSPIPELIEAYARVGAMDQARALLPEFLTTCGTHQPAVGRALFLSTRTVEFHLSRTYRKLGVASRTELTRRLASAGTIPG